MNNKIKRVFISYSWDSQEHQKWVLSLAEIIKKWGIEVVVDKTHLKYGGHIKSFMIHHILDADIVLIILTPNYKLKADRLIGGAGYEYNIINDELYKVIQTNEKFIPILRSGDLEDSVTAFLRGFNCADLRDGSNYEKNLNQLKEQITRNLLQQLQTDKKPTPMEAQYKDITKITIEMKTKARVYFQQLFNKDNEALTKAAIIGEIDKWEKEVKEYNESFVRMFNPSKMRMYEDQLEDFRTKVFANELWTVKAALKTPDPDLARYKRDYGDADSGEVYETVDGILQASINYVSSTASNIDYTKVSDVDDLQLDYLNEDSMFMNKIIGYGIRSEILHRYFPANFPIMTRPSLWAMYFICESANEFITIENRVRENKMRVSHNWQYPYDRFALLMTLLYNELVKWVKEYDIILKPEFRFGYVNMFLSAVNELHKSDVKLLHEWTDK